MKVRWPASKGGEIGRAATELSRLMESDGQLDAGRLVRTLSRAVVHVPMPDAPAEKSPRVAGPDDGGAPLFVIEDDEGRHALVYSSPAALTSAWRSRGRITAAAVPLATLLASWPADTDLVIDAGLPQARQIPVDILREVALDAAGVPTAAAVELSPVGYDVEIPDPEPVQVIGASRAVADGSAVIASLWRAVTRDHEPMSREVLTIVVGFAPETSREQIGTTMSELTAAVAEADPSPVRLIVCSAAGANKHKELIDRVQTLDAPYWSRTVGA